MALLHHIPSPCPLKLCPAGENPWQSRVNLPLQTRYSQTEWSILTIANSLPTSLKAATAFCVMWSRGSIFCSRSVDSSNRVIGRYAELKCLYIRLCDLSVGRWDTTALGHLVTALVIECYFQDRKTCHFVVESRGPGLAASRPQPPPHCPALSKGILLPTATLLHWKAKKGKK